MGSRAQLGETPWGANQGFSPHPYPQLSSVGGRVPLQILLGLAAKAAEEQETCQEPTLPLMSISGAGASRGCGSAPACSLLMEGTKEPPADAAVTGGSMNLI